MKLNGDIAKIWKRTCTFSSPIAWFQAAAPFPVHQSSPSLYVFQVPLFSASLPCLSSRRCSHAHPLFSLLLSFSPFFVLYLYQPLKLNLLQRIPLSFLLFPFFFQKSEYSSPLMQDLLLPYVCSHINSFFLTKYFSYLFECTYLSES